MDWVSWLMAVYAGWFGSDYGLTYENRINPPNPTPAYFKKKKKCLKSKKNLKNMSGQCNCNNYLGAF